MNIHHLMQVLAERRSGKSYGDKSAPKIKPGRELRDGRVHYDGSGPSGYTGTAHAARIVGRPVELEPSKPRRGGRRSRRVRRHKWVSA